MADKDMRGIAEADAGPAKLDIKDASGNKLGNIIKSYDIIDSTGAKIKLIEAYHPTDILDTLTKVQALGYAGFAKGSIIRTSTSLIIKSGAAGTDTWNILTTTAMTP